MKKFNILFITLGAYFCFVIANNIYAKANIKNGEIIDNKLPENIAQIQNNVTDNQPKIQVAILLDSSNSMDGLIEQTRTQIWSVINAVSKVRKNGKIPVFQVSLYHYGNNSLPSAEGFNRMLNELSTDLDKVSENLFSIQTNGGQEYAGWVINSAVNELKWSNNPQDFRVIFIAGNEPFDQGTVDWKKAINSATQKDIIVNTIYCGESENTESNLWAMGASQGKGNFFNLNQDEKVVVIPTPYDGEIARLNQELNDTYIPYGNQGRASFERQQAQDMNAFSSPNPSAGLARSEAKATSSYRNSSWDLVDGVAENGVDLNSVDKTTLPENLRSLSSAEIRKIVDEMMLKREQIKAKIAELAQKRLDYIAKNTPKDNIQATLDRLMIDSLYKQLEAKGFQIQR
ncbi:VWA domain-containing protein [Geminocystis sp. CENA526]|uniref:VWA domain-containing protein n=1 Tax=Geminocystis sp. CENA526 TaxID=1355871 RepID=UPI003D6E0815